MCAISIILRLRVRWRYAAGHSYRWPSAYSGVRGITFEEADEHFRKTLRPCSNTRLIIHAWSKVSPRILTAARHTLPPVFSFTYYGRASPSYLLIKCFLNLSCHSSEFLNHLAINYRAAFIIDSCQEYGYAVTTFNSPLKYAGETFERAVID